MGRVRKALKPVYEVGGICARFVHPISGKTIRIPLGSGAIAETRLAELNTVFLDPDAWRLPPKSIDPDVRSHWLKHCDAPEEDAPATSNPAVEAFLRSENARLADELAQAHSELISVKKQLEQSIGRKIRVGPWPSLANACTDWKEKYQGRDKHHTKNVGWMLDLFVKKFKGDTRLDRMEGREREIEAWLHGLGVKAGVRQQYRRYVLKFLAESGLAIDRKQVPAPKKHEVRRDRKRIEWLEMDEARVVAAALPEYFADAWRVQVGLGLRPDELITLKKSDLRGNMLTLSPLKHLTLKTGSRTICVPEKILKLIKSRLKVCEIVFPQQFSRYNKTEMKAWASERYFDTRYREALQAVPGMPFTLDCRTGRRTCGSILLREGHSVEEVAALLGDRIETIKEHYAAILPAEVEPRATAI